MEVSAVYCIIDGVCCLDTSIGCLPQNAATANGNETRINDGYPGYSYSHSPGNYFHMVTSFGDRCIIVCVGYYYAGANTNVRIKLHSFETEC